MKANLKSYVETDKREMEVKKQENGYECGMHVLEIAYQLIDTKFYSSGMFETPIQQTVRSK